MHSATADLAKSYSPSSSSSSAFNPTEGIPNPQPHPTPQSHVKPLSSSSSVAIAAAARSVVGSSVQSASVSGTATPTAATGTGTGGTGTPNIALLSSLCRSEMSLTYSYFYPHPLCLNNPYFITKSNVFAAILPGNHFFCLYICFCPKDLKPKLKKKLKVF